MTSKNLLLGAGLCLATLSLASRAAPSTSPGDAKTELASIEQELQQEFKNLKQAAKEAGDDDEAVSAIYLDFQKSVLPEFAERFAVVARGNKGSEIAYEAWTMVVGLVDRGMSAPITTEALGALTSDHVGSVKLVELASNLRYSAQGIGEETAVLVLQTIAKDSPHREVKAAALFSLGAVLSEDRPVGDPKVTQAKAVLGSLAEYGDLKSPDGRSYADAAKGFLFAIENLSAGRPCPDFSAVDAEGANFKLSDYKGKVVLVDFWGFW